MTVISAVISTHCIAISSDSFLTVYNSRKKINEIIETKRPKIIRIEKLQAAFSYWGLAAKSKYSSWTTYKWLSEISNKGKDFDSLECYAEFVMDELNKTIRLLGIPKNKSGIGIHLTGYENYDGFKIPELFLISNYTDPTYSKVGDLHVSRHLFSKIPDDSKAEQENATQKEKQFLVKDFLSTGKMFFFNNGDPAMFNPLFNGYRAAMNTAKTRNTIKESNDIEIYRNMAKRPIEMVTKAQKDFFKKGKIVVGGRVHDLVIEKTNGKFSSTSGV